MKSKKTWGKKDNEMIRKRSSSCFLICLLFFFGRGGKGRRYEREHRLAFGVRRRLEEAEGSHDLRELRSRLLLLGGMGKLLRKRLLYLRSLNMSLWLLYRDGRLFLDVCLCSLCFLVKCQIQKNDTEKWKGVCGVLLYLVLCFPFRGNYC